MNLFQVKETMCLNHLIYRSGDYYESDDALDEKYDRVFRCLPEPPPVLSLPDVVPACDWLLDRLADDSILDGGVSPNMVGNVVTQRRMDYLRGFFGKLLDKTAKLPDAPSLPSFFDSVNKSDKLETMTKRLKEWALEKQSTDGPPPADPLAETPPDSDAYVRIGKVWSEHFDTYPKAKKFLADHPEIRTRKPSSNRFEVHAADWVKHWTEQQSEPTDDQIEDYLEGVEQRKREIRRE